MNPLLYRNTSNDRSPESQQVHSLDKVFFFFFFFVVVVCLFVCLFVVFCLFFYHIWVKRPSWSCFRSMAAIVFIGSLVL